jgi:hypothetical protein
MKEAELGKIFADFKDITAFYEVKRVLEFVVYEDEYRLEVLYDSSNPGTPWTGRMYKAAGLGWEAVHQDAITNEKSEESVIRWALSLLG